MFPDLQDKSNLIAVDRLSKVTSGRIAPLPLLIFERCKRSKQFKNLPEGILDTRSLILLLNKSIFLDWKPSSTVKKSAVLTHFTIVSRGSLSTNYSYIAGREMSCQDLIPMYREPGESGCKISIISLTFISACIYIIWDAFNVTETSNAQNSHETWISNKLCRLMISISAANWLELTKNTHN